MTGGTVASASPFARFGSDFAPVLLSAVLLLSQPSPVLAEPMAADPQQYQQQYSQPPSAYDQMQAKAQPFQKVEVNKGRIWLLFVLGASSLFGVTVVVENNGSWFPAISRANKAMKASMKAIEERERLQKMGMLDDVRGDVVDVEGREVADAVSTQDAVLAGLREASANAKETMRAMKEERTPTMIPLELSAEEEDDEVRVDVVDMQGEQAEEALDDIGSLFDAPIPGVEDDVDDDVDDDVEDGVEVVAPAADAATSLEEDVGNRKPLFEISGDDIDASITNRAQQFKEELERSSDDGGGRGQDVDLSNISLEDLQKELEKRKTL